MEGLEPCRQTWNLPLIPKDDEGFVQSFTLDDENGYQSFFKRFGFVVIRNVLSAEEVENSINEIWDSIENKSSGGIPFTQAEDFYIKGYLLEKQGQPLESIKWYSAAFKLQPSLEDDEVTTELIKRLPSKVNRNDPSTWDNDDWVEGRSAGFLGSFVATRKASFSNRQNENLYRIFRSLIRVDNLWVSIDRYGIMRPTRDVPNEKLSEEKAARICVSSDKTLSSIQDRPEWKSLKAWTHWDLNPWKWVFNKEEGLDYSFEDWMSEYNGTRNDGIPKLQGLVSFVDSRDQDGGFCAVPGFHQHLAEWASITNNIDNDDIQRQKNKFSLVRVPEKDSLHDYLEKITVRAGSIIIWSSELPHCNFPNDSDRFRMVQYIKMYPSQEGGKGTDRRIQDIKKLIPTDFEPSPLGRKLFGIDSWK